MTENEQIEEMAKEIYEPCTGSCKECEYYLHSIDNVGCMALKGAKKVYAKGYRKVERGEWIRYPHGSGIYCSRCKRKRRYRDINDSYCPNCGADMRGEEE